MQLKTQKEKTNISKLKKNIKTIGKRTNIPKQNIGVPAGGPNDSSHGFATRHRCFAGPGPLSAAHAKELIYT